MKDNENHVDVEIITTSGSYPSEGSEGVPMHQKIRIILKKAADYLKITSTENWIAKVQGREINTELSFEENTLKGSIIIDFGPREGGGGK